MERRIEFTSDIYKNYLHQPSHLYIQNGTWIITASTYQKMNIFRERYELTMLQKTIFESAYEFRWQLRAWAIFSNHYHLIAVSDEHSSSIDAFIASIHRKSASLINQRHTLPGRQVWYRYWETLLTHQKSYLARLKYVMENPVKHGLVTVASDYPWCSARWFSKTASPKFSSNVNRFKIDSVKVIDNF